MHSVAGRLHAGWNNSDLSYSTLAASATTTDRSATQGGILMNDDTKTTQWIADSIAGVLRTSKYAPQISGARSHEGPIMDYSPGYVLIDAKSHNDLVGKLQGRLPNISEKGIQESCQSAVRPLIDLMVGTADFAMNEPQDLGKVRSHLVGADQLTTAAVNLLEELPQRIQNYLVFIPLVGVELSLPEYDFGPIKLARMSDSLPFTQKALGTAEFAYVNPAIFEHFTAAPCVIEIGVNGDTDYARQEGARKATQLAAILNLHLAIWTTPGDHHQKIRCTSVSSFNSTVTLVRADLTDGGGGIKPTYLPAVRKYGFMAQTLQETQLRRVKQLGFDVIWRCFESRSTKAGALSERVRRAVTWFDKAVSFTEPDAQFVGLATALETLLVSRSDVSNPFSTWSSISQQLADRCALLLGEGVDSAIQIARDVKELYGVRSKIVHDGKKTDRRRIAGNGKASQSRDSRFCAARFQGV